MRLAILSVSSNQKAFVIFFIVVLALLLAGLANELFYGNPPDSQSSVVYNSLEQYDAELLCSESARRSLGEKLQSFHIDKHSTRFDRRAWMYRIFIKADIRGKEGLEEVLVYCHIDPASRDITEYKERNETRSSFRFSDLSFFKD